MVTLTPHLWFPGTGASAARFYASLIPGSRWTEPQRVSDTPSGDVEVFSVTLAGLETQFLSAPSPFRFTPAISLLLACSSATEVDRIVAALAEEGSFLMPLGAYPFSGRYAWVVDRFGLSWQVMFTDVHRQPPGITPTLMYVGDQCGRAEEAIRTYSGLFSGSEVGVVDRYDGQGLDKPGTVRHVGFQLAGRGLAAMDSAQPGLAPFNEAFSLMVTTEDQAETDRLWDALSADPGAEACGWLKDRWGVSWQIVPRTLGRLMSSGNPAVVAAVTQAFLKMKKLDIAGLEAAAHSV